MMNQYYSNRTPAELSLLQELNAYQRNGCLICLDGRPVSPEKIVYACLRENRQYMRDIIGDSSQCIRKINFIRLREDYGSRRERKRLPESGKRPGRRQTPVTYL